MWEKLAVLTPYLNDNFLMSSTCIYLVHVRQTQTF